MRFQCRQPNPQRPSVLNTVISLRDVWMIDAEGSRSIEPIILLASSSDTYSTSFTSGSRCMDLLNKRE